MLFLKNTVDVYTKLFKSLKLYCKINLNRKRLIMEKTRKSGLIGQVAMLFFVCALLTALFTYATMLLRSDHEVKERTESLARMIALDVKQSIAEYPTADWLLRYWQDHCDDMDIEYDVKYFKDSRTIAKLDTLLSRHPQLKMKYATEEDITALPPEDQRLYAEIIYNWVTNRINDIKKSHDVDYLFCVLTDDTFEEQYFLLSAADSFAHRGREYEDVYVLGVTVKVAENQKQAMKDAVNNNVHFTKAGNYADYYEYVADVDGQHMLIGLTYNLSQIMKDINKETTVGTSFATGWQLALMLVTLAMTLGFVVSPLKRIQSAIREYRTTKESSLVVSKLQSMSRNNEIGELSEDVIDLAQSIDRYIARIEKITEEKSRIDSELNLAKSIQASMLPQNFPPFPDRNEVDIYALMEPAKMVGGDFYDFFFIDDDHLALLIADVSGKGIPAALFMMICIVILKNSLRLSKSISKALANTNEAICSNNTNEMFVTVWMGILEISTGKLTAANAGHEYPAIRRKDGSYELIKDKHGFVVGGMRHINYEEYEIQMEPGDKIYVYSDGVPEANNKDKEMFGTARLLDALNSATESTPKEDISNVKSAIAEFVQEEEQFDDVTMLCFEYKGKE